jgi:hypothetical protein
MAFSRSRAVSPRRPPSGGVQQHAGRGRGAAPDAPAQLVQLAQAEALGVLDHHQAGVGHVHADLDHGGGTSTGRRRGERCITAFFSAGGRRECSNPTASARAARRQLGVRGGGVAQIQRLALLDQRADPVHLPALGDLGADALDHLAARGSATSFVTTGVRPGGSSSMVDTSRSA